MNGIMTTPNNSNFYAQDLISSSEHISSENNNNNNNHNNSIQHQHQQQQEQQQTNQQHLQPQSEHSQQPPPQQQQSQSNLSSSTDIPASIQYSNYHQQSSSSSGVPKNQILDNLNYYQQPNYTISNTSDYYNAQNTMGSNLNNDYQNSSMISPSFQMSSMSTPESQTSNIRKQQQIQHAYQQQQPMDLFNQAAGLVGKQQSQQNYKQAMDTTTLELQQQPITYNSNTTPTMLYSQSSVLPLSQYQFSYSPNVPSQMNQMYSAQRQQPQQKVNIPMTSSSIKSKNYISKPSTNGRQLRAASISSSIPQTEYPESVVRPKVATTRWDDENTNCYQVRARNILVSRREDTNYINGTKLLNVIGMTRGKRDGILKTEKVKNVVKVGSMNLKGIWIPFDRAFEIARNEGVDGILYPLFVKDIKEHFLTKGHKLKSEDDLEENEKENDELLGSDDLIRNVEGCSNSTTETTNSPLISNHKYREQLQQQQQQQQQQHHQHQHQHQHYSQKDEDIYNNGSSSRNTPLNVPKPF